MSFICVFNPVFCSLSLCSELNNHSLVTVISGEEEHFEDFGESNDSELLLEAPDGMEGEGSPGSQVHNSTMLLSPRYSLGFRY